MHFDLAQGTVDGQVALDEEQGGVMAGLLQRPDLDRVSLKLLAKGAAAAGEGTLTLAAGDAATATGSPTSAPQIVPGTPSLLPHVSVRPIVGTTESAASTDAVRGQAANAGPSPSARNGSAGTRKRGPGETPP